MDILIILLIVFSLGGWGYYNWKKQPTTISSSEDSIFEEGNYTLKLVSVKSDPSITLKSPTFNVSKINEYSGEEVRKFEFRPQTFEQFIGQIEAKEIANTIIKKTHLGIKAHFIVDGIKGHGKTSYVELVAKKLGAKLIERVGKQIDEESLVDIINEINNSQEKYVILFIDEFETMSWKLVKTLNPILESFKIAGKKIKPFIFAGATINKHILIDKNPDTLDRISHHIKFARYSAEEIALIIKQYAKQMYPNETISEDIIIIVSKNCKFNPRTSLVLIDDYIVEKNIDKILKNHKIIKDGLDEIDINILTALNNSIRPMGANFLSQKVKLSQKEYVTEYEPYLVSYDFLNRIPSRIITEKGKQILKDIKNEGLL